MLLRVVGRTLTRGSGLPGPSAMAERTGPCWEPQGWDPWPLAWGDAAPKTTRPWVPSLLGVRAPWSLETLLYHPGHFLFLRW